ncbi:MAG: chloride channel protein [Lachnospiraceae bacterium]|nr:chloride channel protein [Lachnospiraceae bacterium]
MDLAKIYEYCIHLGENIITFFKWVAIGVLIGVVVGFVGLSFHELLALADGVRNDNPWFLFLLPIGGLVIAGLYKYWMKEPDKGTNLVISAIASKEDISPKLAPLIYISTVITHLFGGSAGREGAAFQIGGCIGNLFGKLLKLDESDKHTIIMCGMSAGFSALFGTPMAAAVFAMEIVSVGVMYYGAIVPCFIASYVSVGIARYFNVVPVSFRLSFIPTYDVETIVKSLVIMGLSAFISGLFCFLLHESRKHFKKSFKNPFIRILVGAASVIILTLVLRTNIYNGSGMETMHECFDIGYVPYFAFLIKMIMTALTLGSGFKGGEIVPSLFVGATFGHTMGVLLNLPTAFASGIGMIGVFTGVTNCPITSLLLSFELFGYKKGVMFYALTVAISYMLSGYYGLYSSQKIMYSKMKTSFIDIKTSNSANRFKSDDSSKKSED